MKDDLLRLTAGFLSRDEREHPVVVLTGSRRSGKTTALELIESGVDRSKLPYALVDCAAVTAETPELLTTLMFALNRKANAYGRLSFPRLLTGLIVMPPVVVDQIVPERAREQIRQELEKYRQLDALRGFIEDLSASAVKSVPKVGDAPGMDTLARSSVNLLNGLVIRGMLGSRLGRKVIFGEGQDWYGHQDRGLDNDAIDELVTLNRRATRMDTGGNQQWVARLLWGAFLADLDASFVGHTDWDRNCAVLLDNADAPAGRMFLTELSEAQNMRREEHRRDAPLTVFAASRGAWLDRVLPLGGGAVPLRDAGVADYRQRRDAGAAELGWYPVLLPDLTEIETRNLVAALGQVTSAAGQATDELLSPVIFQFAEGHPEATRVIIGSLRGAEDPADLATVLGRPANQAMGMTGGQPPTVEQWLLRSLTGGLAEGTIKDLMKCAAARHQKDANRLETESRLLTGPRSARNSMFARELWYARMAGGPGTTGIPALLPVLRRLLLRRLAARSADWSAVNNWLMSASGQAGDPDGEMYYALALGQVDLVTIRMSARVSSAMSEDAAITWLAQWQAVTAAPRAGESEGSEAVPRLVSWADSSGQLTEAVGALVAARWLLANSLRAGDLRGLRAEIAASLDAVAPSTGAGRMTFRAEAEKYRRLAES